MSSYYDILKTLFLKDEGEAIPEDIRGHDMAFIKKTKKWGTHPTQITKYDIQQQIRERELKESSLDVFNGNPIGKEAKNETDKLS